MQMKFIDKLRFVFYNAQYAFYSACESIFNMFIRKRYGKTARERIAWDEQTEPNKHYRKMFRHIPTYVFLYGKMQRAIDARWALLGYKKNDQTEVL